MYPADADSFRLRGLKPGTEYSISIMAFNNMGESNYTHKPIVVTTSGN